MPITILISQKDHFKRVLFLKDGQVIDVDLELPISTSPEFSCLDKIYWGRVIHAEPTHAFVKLSENQVGLLPLEHPFPKPIEGQAVLVQVRREAIPDKGTHHKGPILTRKIIFGGRFCLFHPFQKKRLLSSKLQDPSTRNRLQSIISADEPITLRESSSRASVEEIHTEITTLSKKYSEITVLSDKAPCSTAYDALPSSHRWMRDLDVLEGNKILVDHDQTLIDVRHFLKSHRPDLLPHVKKHKGSLLKEFELEDFWDSLFEDRVKLRKGGNIVIEATTTCIVIDVNQGESSSANHKETNEDAIPVIVQQLKGRHLGGNIIIDFMGVEKTPQDRMNLKDLLLTQAAIYNLPLNVFGWSKLGWMEARLPKRRLPLFSILSL